MAGNKNSGRRPGEAVWVEDGGTKEVTIRKIVKESVNPVRQKLDRALKDVDELDLTEYVKTAFDAGADAMWIFRLTPHGEEIKVGTVKANAEIGDDVETFLLSTFGGPGTFLLKPAMRSSYGGYMRAGHNKRVRLGVSSEQDGGYGSGVSGDAESFITRALAREERVHALNKIQELNRKSSDQTRGGDEPMKAEELVTVVNALKGNDRTAELLLEMLRTERERFTTFQQAQVKQNPLELLVPLATPLFGFLDKKLSPGAVGKWVEMLRNPPTEPETFWTGLRSLLSDFMPVIQPVLASAVSQLTTQPRITNRNVLAPAPSRSPVSPSPQPNGQSTEGAEDMATRKYADEDTKDVMDYAITCLDEHKFPEVFAVLRTCPDTEDVIAAIVPGADPVAFWFAFRDLDERLRTRKDVSLEFIGYIQKQIEAMIAAQMAAQQANQQDGTIQPETAPPAA